MDVEKVNSNDELIIRLIGKMSLEFEQFEDLSEQLKLKQLLEETFFDYDVTTKEKSLMVSDMQDKIKMFIACRKLEGISLSTLKNYNYNLQEFAQFMSKPVISITTNDIRMYMIHKDNVKDSTRSTIIFILKSFFAWLMEEEYIVKNPMNKVKPIKVGKRLKKALTEEQMEKLRIGCINDRELALVEFAYSTAMRVSEIVSVNISDIDWNERSVKIIGKGNSERKAYFSVKSKILLEKYITSRKGDNDALFIGEKFPCGRVSTRTIERIIERIKIRAGLSNVNVTPHKLRHSRATSSINKGVKIEVIQKFLGHKNINTTLLYASLDDTYVKSEHDRSS